MEGEDIISSTRCMKDKTDVSKKVAKAWKLYSPGAQEDGSRGNGAIKRRKGGKRQLFL